MASRILNGESAVPVTREVLSDLLNENLAGNTRPSFPMWSIRR